MFNPALTESMARDRIEDLRRAGAKRSFEARCYAATDRTKPDMALARIERYRRSRPRRAIGWFLVGVGLRLALPAARARSVR